MKNQHNAHRINPNSNQTKLNRTNLFHKNFSKKKKNEKKNRDLAGVFGVRHGFLAIEIFGAKFVAKMMIIHTKREDNHPREQVLLSFLCISDAVADLLSNRKTFIVEREDNFLLCFLTIFFLWLFMMTSSPRSL